VIAPVSSRSLIESVINGLSAGGSINGAGGIQLAYQQAEAGFIEGGIIGNIARAQSARDADRAEFLQLFSKVRPQLGN